MLFMHKQVKHKLLVFNNLLFTDAFVFFFLKLSCKKCNCSWNQRVAHLFWAKLIGGNKSFLAILHVIKCNTPLQSPYMNPRCRKCSNLSSQPSLCRCMYARVIMSVSFFVHCGIFFNLCFGNEQLVPTRTLLQVNNVLI